MSSKNTAFRQMQKVNGQPCAYCKRAMDFRSPNLTPTRDHHVPHSKGGRSIVWACWSCNNIKGDMLPSEWALFMSSTPLWWRLRSRETMSVGEIYARVPSARPSALVPQQQPPQHKQPTFYAKDHPKILARRRAHLSANA